MSFWRRLESLVFKPSRTRSITGSADIIYDALQRIKRLCKQRRLKEALELLELIEGRATTWYLETCVSLLQCCTNMKALAEGKFVHSHLLTCTLDPNIFMLNTVINMYAKCGGLEDAWWVFNRMITRNVFTWTLMIAAFSQHSKSKGFLILFAQMQLEGVVPDQTTFVTVISLCLKLSALQDAKLVHGAALIAGIEPNPFLGSALVTMYANMASMGEAHRVLDRISRPCVESWNALFAGYVQNQHGNASLAYFRQMQAIDSTGPNEVTFAVLVGACANSTLLAQGKAIHSHVLQSDYKTDVFLNDALIDLYVKCGSPSDARCIFQNMPEHDIIQWNMLIGGYVQIGSFKEALNLFGQIDKRPDRITSLSVLKACAGFAFGQGKWTHAYIMKHFEIDVIVGNVLVDMYFKCGDIENACEVFKHLPMQDVDTWNALMTGYLLNEVGSMVLMVFDQMARRGDKPDTISFVSGLIACSELAALQHGKWIHANAVRVGYSLDDFVGNAIIDMYAKCGNIRDASQMFDRVPIRDVISWSTMMRGYAMQGKCAAALEFFAEMQREGVKLNEITFSSLLHACSHAMLVDEGCFCFCLISHDQRFAPSITHYACAIDLLARAGFLNEAREITDAMPFQPNHEALRPLLAACRVYKPKEFPELMNLVTFEYQSASALVLLSNMYASFDNLTNATHQKGAAWKNENLHQVDSFC